MARAETIDGDFSTTHWSLVAGARDDDTSVAHASLLALCLRYWYPVYAYLRRSGHASERAHALTRGFFDSLLADARVQRHASRHRRFRLFLMEELHRYLEQDSHDQVRADALPGPSLDSMEARHLADARPGLSPEHLLRRGFAVEILEGAHRRLRREAREAGRLQMFESLERYLAMEPGPGACDAIARDMGCRPMFIVMAIRRLRQRFRELVDQDLRETLARPEDVQAEREALMQALGEEPA